MCKYKQVSLGCPINNNYTIYCLFVRFVVVVTVVVVCLFVRFCLVVGCLFVCSFFVVVCLFVYMFSFCFEFELLGEHHQ